MGKFVSGIFKPRNPEKYKGNVHNIIYRSSYELKYLMQLDTDSNVIRYNSEEVIIRYRSPIDGRSRRYFVDFYVEKKTTDGVKVMLVELKPSHQMKVPVMKPNRRQKTYLKEVATYAINQAKWEAATSYANKKGWHFVVLNEYDLGIKK